ncbi:unnamed protein product [Euphydryas editha]|uniref:Endonuclease/exonuclease/phosphatase domain-containing protein n=1 Tax=Euphydryas editha TaxID=104508 RepID=A0AAU9TJQ2_EUPED|nr:unnamed protein product [Euphydryas editha]
MAIISDRITKWESDIEDLWVRLKVTEGKRQRILNICAVYLPPPVQQNTLDNFLEGVSALMDSGGEDTIIAGDFNLSFIGWNLDENLGHTACTTARNYANRLGYSLIDFMSENNILQLNTVKNCYDKTLDLIFSNFYGGSVNESSTPMTKVDLYYPPLEITISNITPHLLTDKRKSKLNFRRANYTLINRKLRDTDWITVFSGLTDVDDMVRVLYSRIYSLIDEFVPISRAKNSRFPIWFSRSLIKLLNEKEKIRQRYKRFKNPRDHYEYKLLDDRARIAIRDCYKTYITKTEQNITNNPKIFWSFVKARKSKSSHIPSTMYLGDNVATSGEEISKQFAAHFSSNFIPSLYVILSLKGNC